MEILINTTTAGTITAAVILLIKLLLKDKLTPKWHAAIWLILAVRLLIPGLPESDISVFNAVPKVEYTEAVSHGSGYVSGSVQVEKPVQGSITLKSPADSVPNGNFTVKKQFYDRLIFVWAAGMTIMAVYLTVVWAIFGRRVRSLPVCSDLALLSLFEECKKEAGVNGDRISLRLGGNTPMLLGIRKPVILIPEGYTNEELRHILLHELCHYRHKDIWTNILCCILLSVYWFNPVFWICFFMIRRDMELLCDYRTVAITGERKAYATVLLRTAIRKNHFIFAATSMQNGEKEVAKRIRTLAHFKKPRLWASAAAAAVILAVAVICLTNGTFSRTVIHDAGEGYYLKIPVSWEENAIQDFHDSPESGLEYTEFHDKEGNLFGGIEMLGIDLTTYLNPSQLRQQGVPYDEIDYQTVVLPLPNNSKELARTVIEGLTPVPSIIVDLEVDSKNQTHIFLWPESPSPRIFDLWAYTDKVSEGDLVKIAKTFQKEADPQLYRPKTFFTDDREKAADLLLNEYFQNYADTEMSKASDISGYKIQSIKSQADQEASWSVLYPNAAVFRVDYTLNITYPSQYAFAGGGFEIGEGNKTKIYKDQLAVFSKGIDGSTTFLGFVLPQNAAEMGEIKAIISLLNNAELEEKATALIDAKTPYIGNHNKVRQLVGMMPLAEYFSGLSLQTKEEPYGMTVDYDLTKMGNLIFEGGEERAPTDSRGWDVNPYIKDQLYRNAAMLLSLVDNAGVVSLRVQGISDTGIPYTYGFNLDRVILNQKFVQDARLSTDSVESYCRFLRALEESQIFPAEDAIYEIN